MANTNSLKDRLINQGGSPLSKANGGQPPINQGATKQSRLHAYDVNAGYSVNGNYQSTVNQAYSEYDDGVINALPKPSKLDLQGITPLAPNRNASTLAINNTFSEGTYKNSAPPEGVGRI